MSSTKTRGLTREVHTGQRDTGKDQIGVGLDILDP